MIRQSLFAVWLVDYPVDVKRGENSGGTIVSDYDNTVAAWGNKGVISCRNGIFSAVRSANDKRYERSCYEAFTDINNHTANYIKNFPSRITCWPLNQMSKSRPTQSMCVLEAQFAPVCSA
jgi:hypothetical protein